MKRCGLLWIVVSALVIAGCSKTTAVGAGGAGADVNSDGEFVHDVAIMNLAEIELSRMALDKAAAPDVRALAQQMIDDHGAAGDKLRSVASAHGIAWPAQLDDKHKKTADDLAKKQGAEFDREYAKAMVEGHQNLTALLESRLDVQSLANWKTTAAGRTQGQAMPEPKAEMGDVAIRPTRSGSETTMQINQWAADTYPFAQKHLDSARTIENAAKKRSTD